MQFTAHALTKIGTDSDLHRRVFEAATNPAVRYESRMNGGGFRHIKDGIVAVVDRGAVITFYVDQVETPLRPDQTSVEAIAHARKVTAAAKAQAKNARRDRDRALTMAQKGKK